MKAEMRELQTKMTKLNSSINEMKNSLEGLSIRATIAENKTLRMLESLVFK